MDVCEQRQIVGYFVVNLFDKLNILYYYVKGHLMYMSQDQQSDQRG